ncbi:M24 family metallopeptidase [Xanthobacter sp. KR7-65]|uniref:M24 family metallopeptidase n=1 Tax=Xanthobacter sp. KR7-65 TaxID=3156612 RepID=UPI0032B54CB3
MMPLAGGLPADLTAIDARPADWDWAVRKMGLPGPVATVGFDEMPAALHARLAPLAGGPSLDERAARLRMRKDADEIAAHRVAARLCDELFARLGPELARRSSAADIQVELEAHARRGGADYCRTWLTIRPEADYCRYWPAETQSSPQPGDQVLLGVALTVDGHWGHGIRMGAIGPLRSDHSALHSLVEEMMAAAFEALRPGLPLAGVEAAMEQTLRASGLMDAHPALRRFRNGHGLGHSYEEPMLTDAFPQHFDTSGTVAAAGSDVTIAPGMLLEIHPNLFIPGVGGAALGEMLLVTETGIDSLLTFPRPPVAWA